MKVRFEDPQFAFQFLRVLGSAASHLADVGECFATAAHIVEGDFESWTRAWTRTAERVESIADACVAKGHRVSAGDSYMRASNYFRSAEFYLHGTPSDPRIRELSEQRALLPRGPARPRRPLRAHGRRVRRDHPARHFLPGGNRPPAHAPRADGLRRHDGGPLPVGARRDAARVALLHVRGTGARPGDPHAGAPVPARLGRGSRRVLCPFGAPDRDGRRRLPCFWPEIRDGLAEHRGPLLSRAGSTAMRLRRT